MGDFDTLLKFLYLVILMGRPSTLPVLLLNLLPLLKKSKYSLSYIYTLPYWKIYLLSITLNNLIFKINVLNVSF